jgi:anti-sigma B factor antagonist
MHIVAQRYGEIQSISLEGRFDALSAGTVEEKLNGVFEGGSAKILVDLGEVEYVSSAGLRVLLAALKKARAREAGDIRLVGVRNQVKQVFDIAGFTPLFQIFNSLEDALASYR